MLQTIFASLAAPLKSLLGIEEQEVPQPRQQPRSARASPYQKRAEVKPKSQLRGGLESIGTVEPITFTPVKPLSLPRADRISPLPGKRDIPVNFDSVVTSNPSSAGKVQRKSYSLKDKSPYARSSTKRSSSGSKFSAYDDDDEPKSLLRQITEQQWNKKRMELLASVGTVHKKEVKQLSVQKVTVADKLPQESFMFRELVSSKPQSDSGQTSQAQPDTPKLASGGGRSGNQDTPPLVSGFKFGESPQSVEPEKKSGFSFGSPDKTSTSANSAVSGFSFGNSTQPETKDDTKATNGFSFGAPPAKETVNSTQPTDDSPKPSVQGSAVGSQADQTSDSKPLVEPQVLGNLGFSFGSSVDTSTLSKETQPATTHGFSFGGKADAKAPAEQKTESKGFSFGSAPQVEGKVITSFNYGSAASTQSVPAASKGVSFGGSSTDKPATESKGFSFGSAAEVPKTANVEAHKPDNTPASKPVTFGSAPSGSTGFTFGQQVEPKPATAVDESSKPTLGSFGQKPEEKPSFAFGQTGATKSDVKPAFKFGSDVPSQSMFGAQISKPDSAQTESKPAFSFGSNQPALNKPDSTPAFSFGSSLPAANKPDPKPAFSFGSGSVAQPAFSFGQESKTMSHQASDESMMMDSNDQTVASQPAFTFGQNTSSTPAQSSFQFGQQPQAQAPTSFQFNSGQSTQAPNTFNVQQPGQQPSFQLQAGSNQAGQPPRRRAIAKGRTRKK